MFKFTKKRKKHRKYENDAFNRVKSVDTVLSRCVNPAKFGFPRDVIDRIINYNKNKTDDAKYKSFKDIFDKNKLHYSFYKFWGFSKEYWIL